MKSEEKVIRLDQFYFYCYLTGELAFTERPPSSLTVHQGKTEILNCSASSWPPPTITWILNGKEIMRPTTNRASLKIIVNVEQGTEYICVAKSTKSEIKAKTTLLVRPGELM